MYTIMQRVDGGEWKKTLACRVPSQREAERLAEKMTRDHNRESGKLYEYHVVKNVAMTFIIQQILRVNGKRSATFVKRMERQDMPAEFATMGEAQELAAKLPGLCYIYRKDEDGIELVESPQAVVGM